MTDVGVCVGCQRNPECERFNCRIDGHIIVFTVSFCTRRLPEEDVGESAEDGGKKKVKYIKEPMGTLQEALE